MQHKQHEESTKVNALMAMVEEVKAGPSSGAVAVAAPASPAGGAAYVSPTRTSRSTSYEHIIGVSHICFNALI